MKNRKLIDLRKTFMLGLVLTLALGCERDLSDDATPATFAKTGEVFLDTPVGMGTDFYFPFAGSKLEAASFDGEGFESTNSVRVDVPNPDDVNGNYAGAIFRVDGAGRDLTDFDAVTFARCDFDIPVELAFCISLSLFDLSGFHKVIRREDRHAGINCHRHNMLACNAIPAPA